MTILFPFITPDQTVAAVMGAILPPPGTPHDRMPQDLSLTPNTIGTGFTDAVRSAGRLEWNSRFWIPTRKLRSLLEKVDTLDSWNLGAFFLNVTTTFRSLAKEGVLIAGCNLPAKRCINSGSSTDGGPFPSRMLAGDVPTDALQK
jgi:hypothetical protein